MTESRLNESDHDLLISLNTRLDMFMKSTRDHMDQDSKEHAIFERDIKASHRRLDQYFLGGIIVFVVSIVGVASHIINFFLSR